MLMYLRITERDGAVLSFAGKPALGKDEKMFAQEYMELSAEAILIIEESRVDSYIKDMCDELKAYGLFKPEYEFFSANRLERILEVYNDKIHEDYYFGRD